VEKATTARGAFERKLDKYLAEGESRVGLKGLGNLASTLTASPAGQWFNSGGEVIADPEDMKADVELVAKKISLAMAGELGAEGKAVRILLPLQQHIALATTLFSPTFQNKSVLDVLNESPLIESVRPWNRLSTMASNGTGRVVGLIPDPRVVQGFVPTDFEQMAPQLRNMSYLVNCHGRFGGVISRYPIGVCYMDGTGYHA
jgi:hypothetical protein